MLQYVVYFPEGEYQLIVGDDDFISFHISFEGTIFAKKSLHPDDDSMTDVKLIARGRTLPADTAAVVVIRMLFHSHRPCQNSSISAKNYRFSNHVIYHNFHIIVHALASGTSCLHLFGTLICLSRISGGN